MAVTGDAIDDAIREMSERTSAAIETVLEPVVAALPAWHGPFRPRAVPTLNIGESRRLPSGALLGSCTETPVTVTCNGLLVAAAVIRSELVVR